MNKVKWSIPGLLVVLLLIMGLGVGCDNGEGLEEQQEMLDEHSKEMDKMREELAVTLSEWRQGEVDVQEVLARNSEMKEHIDGYSDLIEENKEIEEEMPDFNSYYTTSMQEYKKAVVNLEKAFEQEDEDEKKENLNQFWKFLGKGDALKERADEILKR